MTEQEKNEIVDRISEKIGYLNKKVMTSTETAKYLGISLSRLYKLTHAMAIPHYKPQGKINYFDRDEIEAWALRNRIATVEDLNNRAQVMARR